MAAVDLTALWASVEKRFGTDVVTAAPAVSVGVLVGDVLEQRAFGTADLSTGELNTPETLFEIGSITKPWTATVVMRLWERGRLDLDAPVRELVPEFSLAGGAGAAVTPRHLLSHTAGIGPDTYDADLANGMDSLLAHLRQLPPLWEAGSGWQYSNLGYVVLGRLIEVVTGQSFAAAMRTELLEVLGRPGVSISGEQVPGLRAKGYDSVEPGRVPEAQEPGQLPGYAPAGSTPAATGRDVLTFAAAHVRGGAVQSPRLLQETTTRRMRRAEIAIENDSSGRTAWGLGWGFWRVGSHSGVIGHGGSTAGFSSSLLIHPTQPVAVVVLANSLAGAGAMFGLAARTFDHALAACSRPDA